MIRKFCSIGIAYLLALGIVAATVAGMELFPTLSMASDPSLRINAAVVAIIVYMFAFITTAIPFAVARSFAGIYDLLSYKTAAIGGAILGPVAAFLMSFTGASLRYEPLVFLMFAAWGLVCGVCYWWIELRVADALALSDNSLAGA
jgi:hypothetical protein